MDEYGRMGPHRHRRASFKGRLLLIGIIVIIAIIAVLAYYFLPGQANVSSLTTLTINGHGTPFTLGGQSYVATLAGYNNNTGTAYVYLSSVPVFLGPVLNITLHRNSTVKVNYDGQFAIMQMTQISANGASAQVQISPLAISLQISPDYQYIGHPTVPLPGLQVTITTTVPAANSTTTTVQSGGSGASSTSTTLRSTTTVLQTNYTDVAIKAAIKGDQNYALMANFSGIYNNTVNCTSKAYNMSYFEQFASLPMPPEDFPNVSYETPYSVSQKIVSTGGNNYAYEFIPSVKDSGFNGKPALTIGLTVTAPGTSSASATVNSNSYNGILQGETYSALSSQYQQTKSVTGACAAMVG